MSKNLTRKGLALGSIVALGSSLFAGAPAFAGVESAKITLAPNAGTTYTTLIGASYEFKTELDQTITNAGLENKTKSELTFLVSNPSAQSINLDLDGAGATYGDVKALTADTTDMTGSLPSGTASYTTTAKYIAITMDPASQSVDTADVAANLLKVTSSTDSTDAFAVTVQAFIDDNNDGEIGTFELTSPARTLNFIKASAATVTTTVSSATIGTSTIKGKIVIGNDVNNASLAGQLSIGFFKNSTAVKVLGSGSASVDTVDVQWDSTDSVLTNTTYNTLAATGSGTGNTVTADTYTAKAYFGVARALIGTESAAVAPVAGTVTSADHTDFLVATGDANAINASTVTTTVRSGYKGAVKFTSQVLNANNGGAAQKASDDASVVAIAGVKVKVTLTKGTTFGAAHEVTAGGVKLTATSGAVSYETTTDAAGAVAVNATSNLGTLGDSYVVKVQVLTDTAGYETGDLTTVTFADATVASIDAPAVVGNNAELSVAKGGSVSLAYDIRDNFGASSTVAGTYRISVASSSVTGGGSVSGTAPVSAGKATFSFTDNTITATGKYTVTATLQKLNTAGDAYENVGSVNVAHVVNVGTAAVSALSVPANATSGIALEPIDFVNHDFRLDVNSKTFSGLGFTGGAFTVSGTATSANGAVVPGATVVISAKGLQFVAANSGSNSDATVATDSITVQTTSAGAYSVVAYSHTAGDVNITVTSGSVSKTVLAKWSYATAADKNSKLTVTGATAPKAGSSNSYVIALTDKWGNAIKGAVTIKVEVSGAGYLTSTPTAVSAVDGKATVTLVLQPADTGSTTIKATYDVASSDTDVVGSLVVNAAGVPAAATAAVSGSTGKFYVSATAAAGKSVVVKVAGKFVTSFKATGSKKTVAVKATKGSKKVTVYVGGKLTATKTVTVK